MKIKKIEVGKYYKTRDGHKVRVYANDGSTYWPIHGAILNEDDWYTECWRSDGSYRIDNVGSVSDIICEWKEPLDFDPSCLPAWAQWIAMDEDRSWYYYDGEPKPLGHYWGGNLSGLIPVEYAPKNYEGGIEDSLHCVADLKTLYDERNR